MKIVHAIVGLEETSGITLFVIEVANRMSLAGHEVTIVTEKPIGRMPNGSVRIIRTGKVLSELDYMPDIVHIHAVWSMFSVKATWWCRTRNVPYVVSPHGCLMPRVFAKGRIKKSVFYWLMLWGSLNRAAVIHVTSDAEGEAILNIGIKAQHEKIPLGVNVSGAKGRRGKMSDHLALFVGRIGEEKGLVNLLYAWNALCPKDWRLVIAGPDWQGHRKVLEKIITRLHIPNITMPGTVAGVNKDELYNKADLFVLPSPMENFSAVVLEALSHGVPVIATKGTPWQELQDNKCGWWIEQGQKALESALKSAMSLADSERSEMGARGRELVANKYSWDKVADRVLALYKKVVDGK